MNSEQKALFDELTKLQQRIAINVLAGMTQRDAYYNAGGKADTDESADSSCSQILSNIKVRAFIDSMQMQAVSDAIMTREEAIKKLSLIARTDLKDIVKFRTGVIGKNLDTGEDVEQTTWTINEDLQEEDSDKLSIISELEVGKFGPKIKTHDQKQAIALLSKLQGWEAAQKFEHAGPGGGPIQIKSVEDFTDEQLAAIAMSAPVEDK